MFGFLVGDAEGGVAGEDEFAIAPAVTLEGEWGGVEGTAVGLDDEAVVRPEEVHLDAAVGDLDRGIEERRREVAREEQRQQLCLEWALEAAFLGDGRSASPFACEGAQRLHPPPPGIHRRLDRRDIEDAPLRRPLEAAPQRPVADGAREVHQGPRGARAGNSVNRATLVPPRRANAMKANPVDLASPLRRCDDVDDCWSLVQQTEERSGASMGDDGTAATGERRSSHSPLIAHIRVAKRVDPMEHSVQSPALDSTSNYPIREAQGPELSPAHHPMLGSSQPRQPARSIGVPFGPHGSIRHTAGGFAPRPSGKMRSVSQNGDIERGRYEGPQERLFAVRGAVQAEANEPAAILSATEELMRGLIERNGLEPEAMVSCLFTTTEDLDAEFPAVAARDLGLTMVPLMCCREIPVPGSMPRVIRVMLHFYAPAGREAAHVYVGEAQKLRADLEAAQ